MYTEPRLRSRVSGFIPMCLWVLPSLIPNSCHDIVRPSFKTPWVRA